MKYIIIALLLIINSPLSFAAQLDISKAKVKENIPGNDNTAAYMVVKNLTKEDVRIIDAESNVSEFTELHTHTMKNDRMIMRHIEHVDIPAGETLYFSPNSYHIMLINLNKRLKHGEHAKIVLKYADGTSQTVEFDVYDPRKAEQ